MKTISDIITEYVTVPYQNKANFIENLLDEDLELFIDHCQNSYLGKAVSLNGALSQLQSEYDRRKKMRRENKLNDLGL